MKKKQKILIIRVALLLGTVISLFFVPWLLVKAWIFPLPDTVQEQLDEAIGHGFDGMIVYIDQAEKPPRFYAAGWHDRESGIPAKPQALFKISSISKLYDAVVVEFYSTTDPRLYNWNLSEIINNRIVKIIRNKN